MKNIFGTVLILLWANRTHCSISGISYQDPLRTASTKSKLAPGEDPCNPLYWYPRNIPEFCDSRYSVTASSSEAPPVSSPLPPSPPMLAPMPPIPPPIPVLSPPFPILPIPLPLIAGPQPLPIFSGYPPPPMISSAISNPYLYTPLNPVHFNPTSSLNSPYSPSFQNTPTGYVPGMHGLVTKDGGINIMPFSDAYADMFEKHKNKMIRRKLHKILDKYKLHSSDYRSLRKYEKYFTDD